MRSWRNVLAGIGILTVAAIASAAGIPAKRYTTFPVTCGTTATQLAVPDDTNDAGVTTYGDMNVVEWSCWNTSATPVYFGGSDVNTTDGKPICHSGSCVGGITGGTEVEIGSAYCVVASSTQDVYCEAVSAL